MLTRWILAGALVASTAVWAQQPPPEPRRGPGMGARFLGAEPGRPGRVVKNAPFTADVVTETTQTLPDGNHIKQTATSHVYRDSEGRTRREQSLNSLNQLAPGLNLPQVVFIDDPVASTSYAMNTRNKTATRSVRPTPPQANGQPGAQTQMARRGPPPGGANPGMGRGFGGRAANRQNMKTEALGRQTIEGVPADGTRTTMTIPAGQIGNDQPIVVVRETWYSPDLQEVVLSKHSDPRNGETVYRLANVSRTEPPHTLFEVPADFKVSDAGRGGRGPQPQAK